MARMSRNKKMAEEEQKADGLLYRTGFYLRLSDKDGRTGPWEKVSSSIENQKLLLLDFINSRPEFQLVSVFIDDGKTGINFQRSGFEQMMEAVKCGEINCIIVKDLSRFGRNYLEAGHYIEYIFPFLHVRFIAVTDGFDTLTATSTQLSYLIPLKNLMNENYAVDISKKERSAKKILRKKGCFIGAYAMYGYEKTGDKHKIKIDPEAAVYVKMIFALGEQGYSDSVIAKYLNQQEILCPARYKYEKGILKHEKYAASSRWYPQTVAGILNSRIYIGDMVQGKQASRQIRGKKEMLSQESWDIVCGTHEAIIPKEQFEHVQKIRRERHERYQKVIEKSLVQADEAQDKGMLKGKIYCGDCGKAMVRKQVKGCKDRWRYICEIYEKTSTCSRKYLPERELYERLECLVRQQMKVFCEAPLWERKVRQEKVLSPGFKEKSEEFAQKWKENEEKQKELLRKKALFYQEWKEGRIDREEYFYRKLCCEQEISSWEKEKEKWVTIGQNYGTVKSDQDNNLEIFLNDEEAEHLPKAWINALVERIEVFEKSRIKVCFRFAAMEESG